MQKVMDGPVSRRCRIWVILGAVGLLGTCSPVSAPEIASVEVTPLTTTLLFLGDTVRIVAMARDARGAPVPDVRFSWASSDSAVASVDSAGLVTARARGTAQVTASIEGIPGAASVTVQQIPSSVSVAGGDQQSGPTGRALPVKVSVMVRDSGGSPAPDVVVNFTVTQSPGVIGYVYGCSGRVTPASQATDSMGIAAVDWILGFYPGTNGVAAAVSGLPELTFTATGIDVDSSLQVSASKTTLKVGESAQLEAKVYVVSCADAHVILLPVQAAWSSSDPAVATIGAASGSVVAKGPGTVQITGTYGQRRGSITMTVIQVIGTLRVVSGDRQSGAYGQALPESLVVQVVDTLGQGRPGIPVSWSSHERRVYSEPWHVFAQTTTRLDGTTAVQWVPGGPYLEGHTARAEISTPGILPSVVAFGAAVYIGGFAGIGVGYAHVCGLVSSGHVTCWGRGFAGWPLTVVSDASGSPLTFSSVASGGPDSAESPDRNATCAVTTVPTVWCWNYSNPPSPLANDASPGLVSVSVGGTTNCGLTTAGAAYCWGGGRLGQRGDGDTTALTGGPVPVLGSLAFAALDLGADHGCGVTTDSLLYCWGSNAEGQLGAATTGTCAGASPVPCSTRPLLVPGDHEFITVAAAEHHSCALAADGRAYCWGSNAEGQLGDGTMTDRSGPTPVATSLVFQKLTAGGSHTCGLTSDGSAYCWGSNGDGELGNGSQDAASAPVAVLGGLVFAAIDAGGLGTCGVTMAGVAYCWGSNRYGQLGAGSGALYSAVPVRVARQEP